MDQHPPTAEELAAVLARLERARRENQGFTEERVWAICDVLALVERAPGGLEHALMRLFLRTSTAIYTAPPAPEH